VQNAASVLIRSQTSRTHHTDWPIQRCVNFIGCLSDDELNSRLPARYTKCCQAKYLPIWLTIFMSPQKVLLAPSGPLCFAAGGPRIWNNLPGSLRDKEVSCTEFRRQLKTSMFQTDCGASWLFWSLRLINILIYLLTQSSNLITKHPTFGGSRVMLWLQSVRRNGDRPHNVSGVE